MAIENIWVNICWDADDGLAVDDPNHVWGATGCTSKDFERACDSIARDYPNALISVFFDDEGLRNHLAETGRSL